MHFGPEKTCNKKKSEVNKFDLSRESAGVEDLDVEAPATLYF